MAIAPSSPPARADGDAFLLEPPEERDGVRDVAEVVGRVRTDLHAVDSEHPVVIAGLEMEQRQVPGHVEGEVVAPRPDRPRRFQPGDALVRAALHLMDVADGMEPPRVLRLNRDCPSPGALGGLELSGFLERQRMTTKKEAVARPIGRPSLQHPRARREHPRRVAEHEAQRMRDLGRQERAGIALENLVEDHRGARKVTFHRFPERSNQRSLVDRSATGAPKGGASGP
jgi:hypothetical protein